jgi:hypothetical protein
MTDASGHDAREIGGALRRETKPMEETDVKYPIKNYFAHMLTD